MVAAKGFGREITLRDFLNNNQDLLGMLIMCKTVGFYEIIDSVADKYETATQKACETPNGQITIDARDFSNIIALALMGAELCYHLHFD